jgi:hypothetical protein
MIQQFDQYLQPLIAGELLVKIAIRPFRLGEAPEFPYGFIHAEL